MVADPAVAGFGHRPLGKLLTYAEAAEFTNRHRVTIYRWVQKGHVRPRLDEGQWKVGENDLLKALSTRWPRRPRSQHW